jgi:hypothetical protein
MAGKVIETQELRERFQKVRVSVLLKQGCFLQVVVRIAAVEDL